MGNLSFHKKGNFKNSNFTKVKKYEVTEIRHSFTYFQIIVSCLKIKIRLILMQNSYPILSCRRYKNGSLWWDTLYVEDGAKLPSVTICIKWLSINALKTLPYREGRILSLPDSENWTFVDYMEYGNVAKNVIKYASFLDQPHDRKS